MRYGSQNQIIIKMKKEQYLVYGLCVFLNPKTIEFEFIYTRNTI